MIENGIVKIPVSLDDIKNILGVNNNDMGYLCSNKHGKVNKWSKNKPMDFRVNGPHLVGQLSDVQKQSILYGLENHPTIEWKEVLTSEWAYSPPIGGAASPYRISDFVGYSHTATAPLRNNTGNVTWNTAVNGIVDLHVDVISGQPGQITMNDLTGSKIGNYYLCLIVQDQTSKYYYIKTGPKISSEGPYIFTLSSDEEPWTGTAHRTYKYWWVGSLVQYPIMKLISGITTGFTDLPFSNSNSGEITKFKDATYALSASITGLSTHNDMYTCIVQNFITAENYYTSKTTQYFKVNTTGNFCLELTFKNTSQVDQYISAGSIRLSMEPNLSKAIEQYVDNKLVNAYNKATGQILSGSIVLSANKETKVCIGLPGYVLYNSDGALDKMGENKKIKAEFSLNIGSTVTNQVNYATTFPTTINMETYV